MENPNTRRLHAVTVGAVLGLVPSVAAAMPTIGTTTPAANSGIPDLARVTVVATSPLAVTSVTAQVGAVSRAMFRQAATNNWLVDLDLTAEPLGAATLHITASDGNG